MSGGATGSRVKVATATGPRTQSEPSYHVIARQNHWSVKKSGAQRAARVFANEPEAVAYAMEIAVPAAVEVVVHRKDGSVALRISPTVTTVKLTPK
jgi:uncharacterized protein YdaT